MARCGCTKLESVVELVKHSSGKNIQFVCEAGGALPALTCDREQMSQVVLNLAINAAQAMPDGGTVRLTAEADGGEILIQVIDEGIGVPDELIEKVFDPFFTTKDSGTGLGLPVVHQIVRQHGGTVNAARNSGKGMTFTVRFPRKSENRT
jgi:signal transduction histidine kinase